MRGVVFARGMTGLSAAELRDVKDCRLLRFLKACIMRLSIAMICRASGDLLCECFQALPVDLEHFCAGDVDRKEHG